MDTSILVIEDVPEMADLVALYLRNAGFSVTAVQSAEQALDEVRKKVPDLVILDLNLPGMSGFDFLKTFRAEFTNTVPVVIVSARDADEDIIAGLGIGADEFVTKPFSPRVLVARVEANVRRQAKSEAAAEATYTFGDYTVLLNSCVLKKGAQKIALSAKEYEVLAYFIRNEGTVLSPETIYNDVWKTAYGDITAVAVYVQRLRKKIEADPAKPAHIKTVFGQGYRFDRADA